MNTEHASPQRLSRLRDKRRQLAERIKQIEARHKVMTRKHETQRKLLLGALFASWMREDAALEARVNEVLPQFLTRQVDRDVFNLKPLAGNAVASQRDAVASE